LDWSYSALAALWFCVWRGPARDEHGDAVNGVVWILKTRRRDFVPSENQGDRYDQSRTRIFRPRFVSRRIMAQSGLFTCHKLHRNNRFFALEGNPSYKDRLRKVVIPGYQFTKIREQLQASGTTSLSLFPDLEGLAGFLKERYFYDPHELKRPDSIDPQTIKIIGPAALDRSLLPRRSPTKRSTRKLPDTPIT